MKRKLLIGIVAVMIFAFGGVGVIAAKADFSGVWTLDAGKSEGVPPTLLQTMTVTQKDDRLEIETKSKVGEQPERVAKDIYVLDGKEADFTPPNPPDAVKKAKRISKWTDDGNGFDATEEAILIVPNGGGDTPRQGKRSWRLSADGKTLTIEVEMQSPSGTNKSRRVFVKK